MRVRVRFDDSLKTVLAADTSSAFGARAAFRQLVDLVARGRVALDGPVRQRLEALRSSVPLEVRAGIARSLALTDPPPALVLFLADDHADVAAAVLRGVRLAPESWEWLVHRVGPLGRSILRRRADLPPSASRALESFGSTDFALPDDSTPVAVDAPAEPAHAALRTAEDPVPADTAQARPAPKHEPERFEIAELVSRIAAYQRDRIAPAANATASVAAFRFETDAAGVIRWIDSAPRGAVIGVTLDHRAVSRPCVDGVAAGAFRKRAAFSDARLVISGSSPLAGDWRISAVPMSRMTLSRTSTAPF